MPELPDVTVYAEHLERLLKGATLRKVRLASPFVLRSVAPPPGVLEGRALRGVSRLGKRLVFSFDELFFVLHLMIAGRLQWKAGVASAPIPIPKKIGLLSLDFDRGSLLLREASPKKRAWVRVVEGRAALAALDPGGLEPLEATREAFVARLRSENHTLKRALTDPTLFSGIGNAYSDEILHAAKLSPVALTSRLADRDAGRLFDATRATLAGWTDRLRREAGDAFPEKVTAFREDMAVHGKFGKPCPVCGTAVQRIVYESNETNYCPKCQTGGKLLADRSLSRLLRGDWPKSLEELEERKDLRRQPGAADHS
ncbi:MAG TPA: DNA-formamidopyrimidine glycosylase family protein [Thermoanaerobaculia bacterium]|nr:DNA-formamidopyrimidine glycosylase family protein [Thermoanaerobaculia bacterium]